MNNGESVVAGIDVGGTNLRLALVAENGNVIERLKMPTGGNRAAFISQLSENILLLSDKAVALNAGMLGVGIGMPGLISPSGEIFSSVNLSYCEGLNLATELQSLTGLPVVTVNDANAAAFGEYRFGAGRSLRTFIMITIGTGIGGGIILDGRLWSGADGFAGEFGHLTVVPGGRGCPCGNNGCVERYASATAILATAREQGMLSSPDASVETLAAMSAAGDLMATKLFEDAGRYLGSAAAAAVNLLNPEAIIIGGGVAASFGIMREAMSTELCLRAYRPSVARLKILRGDLHDDAGVLGAAAVAFDRYGTF
ncbi:glucokinase [Geobacter sp. OR-1]|uniref:ROK family protein n=1 Tax=Geobacter sp. OR-1 TaxID=1266765 RepID=UPI0005442694|nr:ROK family protein [Geobacter sp. OR-1]GAM10044.1 glucokinase [Geobacter sp. OR-1]